MAPSAGERRLRQGAALALLVAGLGWGMRESLASTLIRRAKRESVEAPDRAISALRRAARVSPCHPDPPAVLSEVDLARAPSDPGLLRQGEAWARRAVRLRDPRAYGYYMISLYRFAAGDLGEAYVMLERALARYPQRELYRAQEQRLRQFIRQFPAEEPSDGR